MIDLFGDPSGSRTRVPDVRGGGKGVRLRPNLTKSRVPVSACVSFIRPCPIPWLSNWLSKSFAERATTNPRTSPAWADGQRSSRLTVCYRTNKIESSDRVRGIMRAAKWGSLLASSAGVALCLAIGAAISLAQQSQSQPTPEQGRPRLIPNPRASGYRFPVIFEPDASISGTQVVVGHPRTEPPSCRKFSVL